MYNRIWEKEGGRGPGLTKFFIDHLEKPAFKMEIKINMKQKIIFLKYLSWST